MSFLERLSGVESHLISCILLQIIMNNSYDISDLVLLNHDSSEQDWAVQTQSIETCFLK